MPGVEVTGKMVNTGAQIAGNTIITSGQLQNSVGMFRNDVVQYATQLPGWLQSVEYRASTMSEEVARKRTLS